jgi:hypothetical protein
VYQAKHFAAKQSANGGCDFTKGYWQLAFITDSNSLNVFPFVNSKAPVVDRF